MVGVLLLIVTLLNGSHLVYAEKADSKEACVARGVELKTSLEKRKDVKVAEVVCFPVKLDDTKVAS